MDGLAKAALIEAVADAGSLTNKRAEIVVDTAFGSIVEMLRRGEDVELRGFGSFRLRRRRPHQGRNPRTGGRVDVPSKQVACFKPGKQLKTLLSRDLAQPDSPPRPGQPASNVAPPSGSGVRRRPRRTRAGSLCERRVKPPTGGSSACATAIR